MIQNMLRVRGFVADRYEYFGWSGITTRNENRRHKKFSLMRKQGS